MPRHLVRVVAHAITVGLTVAASTAAAETEWYQPQQVDSVLEPPAANADGKKKRPPIILRGELSFAAYQAEEEGGEGFGEKGLRVRVEQQWATAFVGVTQIGDFTAAEIGGEFHTGGIVLADMPDGKVSLMTPSVGFRYVTETEEMPGLKGIMFSIAGLRYCRCASARPLVIDVRAPVLNVVIGSAEDEVTGIMTEVNTIGWGANVGIGLGF